MRVRTLFDMIMVLPTWLIVAAAGPALPAAHIWKQRMPTLFEWSRGATPLCFVFGGMMWGSSLSLAFVLLTI
jgi:hypothetical protein